MFHVQGSFEQSLRCGDELSPNGNKTLAALAKIHKHCTGKAHANGCADHKHNPLAKSDSNTSLHSRKSFRNECIIEIKESDKNSHNAVKTNDGLYTKSFSNSTSSYEGHSDTDSENTFKSRQEQHRSADPCERLFAQNTKASLMKTARMRYADDSVICALQDEVDGEKVKQPFSRTPLRGSYRDRKSGVVTIEEVKLDGSNNDEELANSVLFDEKRKTPTQTRSSLQRKGSVSSTTSNGKPNANGTKPPWRGASKKGIPNEPFVRTPSFRGSIRKKVVKNDGIPWKKLYELSLWRRYGVSFAAVGADAERVLLRPWTELSSQHEPPPFMAKSEEQLECEKEWLQAGHMWLAHRGGFTAVVREAEADAGRAKVRVLQTGEILTVDEDDLEKANPPQLERCEDIAALRCLNECGALNVLRARFAAGLPHARAGHALLVLGPPKRTAPIYTDKVAAMFRGCRADDMPPHVFAAAQSTHRCMLASRRDRAIVFLGRSGSGKTSAMRHCIWYLASAYPAQGSKLTPERLDAAFDVLHMFGSTRTGSNPHASRFVSLTSLDFDGGGALAAASVQVLLPDLRPGQAPLRALHTLYHGCDGRLRRELLLEQAPVTAPNPFLTASERADAPTEFSALKDALQLIGVTEQEQMAMWKIMAAICHLGWAGAVKANTGSGIKYQFASTGCGQRASRLLGVGSDELARAVFLTVPTSPQPNSNLRTPSPSNEREMSGAEAVDAFVTGLYNETFNIVSALVNRSLSTSARTSASILLLDTPGADNPMCAGQQSGAPLSKLLSNYLQERLQAMFHEAMLVAPRDRYAQEGITLDDGAEEDWLSETVNPGPMVELLDKAPQNTIVRSSQADLRECDRRGLLWLLDEESMYPGSSDDTFLERVMSHYGAPSHTHYLIKKAPHARQFVLQHLQGTNPVLYDVTGWVKASRENPVTKKSLTLLQESQNEEIGRLSSWSRGACGPSAWAGAPGDVATLRRASSIRRTLTSGTAGMKRRSTALQAKFVADGIVDTLRRCGAAGVSFVCCLLTNQPADTADDVNVPLLRSQFRGFQLLDAARLYKQGFPEHMPLSEFARRYRLLATSETEEAESTQTAQTTLSDRQIVDDMLLTLDLDVTSYRLGLTQIMFRGGVVGELDARRDAALARVLVRLQARARGLLARRRAQRLRTQHTAARCVQRNVRAFLAVRDWPWWRLLVRVTPLLAVHRTEHRLKHAQEELETLRAKLDKVESERTHYKNETERLETKLSEVGGELTEERAAAALATERADAEAAERLRVERDNRDLLANNQRLQQASERLELELLHWRSADSGGAEPSDSEGSEADASAAGDKYKRRFERAHRELQLLRAQLRRQHEDDLEQLVSVKKQLEKKVQDAYEEVEEQRAVAAQWKRKLQKLTNDMADLRSLLDEQTCRNNLLEKRQRKFDGELQAAQEELKRERSAKERLSRERDQAHAEKYAIEQSLSEARLELELKEERLAAATRELEERGGGGDELTALRRNKSELERRVRDQEEELDELAGQIQLLESSKLRLEMLLEQQRKEARLEAAARDDEMEETRANAAKKLKMLESQLESEHSERSLLLRERHELERRLTALEETARAENHEQAQLLQRLKRDLKRYRALLRDAQTMLEQKEKEGGAKAQIRQLKNQVEDLELAVRAATKARQTAEAEAAEANAALDEATRARSDAAERAMTAAREAAAARAQLDDAEEEAAELLKKYRSSTSALVAAQSEAREACARADAAGEEARAARDKLAELAARLAQAEAGQSQGQHEAERRLELRNKELESSLELEATARSRLEGQLARLRDAHDALAAELGAARAREQHAADELRKVTRQMRELKEENSSLNAKLSEAGRAKAAAESAAAAAASEAAAARDEARLAARRAAALQEALAGDLGSPADSRDSDSDNDSYSSDESIGTFLANHKLSPSAPSRNSVQLDSQKSHTPEGRQSRSSVGSSKQMSPTKESFA
ncbi:unconventional myosin-XVIIIa isoform X2 [Trichoplusia ni]|uniref:Unconventional myosin-XVIIIa isoform X2 n=1 Tax=Trichoplusia ni TaxID=7111 RepID=A0A7E5VGF8_TRINI|nr:unconventional myosin-XVIIIa isoform X2 [Trichoplusia ni]XP_026727359.1 unconventional myosin-XVIIIa isoform X2 [Trichoplusia ni]XP_026727367.1 unconventional myosin-XVIIIa isoform X2 [Trichoplusia ni]XP_026727374.1 unconventional myosin-XVIIIa isoform X2 [Trichoplusia ni]XP_026727385.1 unconventional myosin-XVIIIa isoform X2 [Trichoplusia ni]XP_026727394.1 unconventional myosin-XVIIIa isoform X2 [Trichoplusia ni]